MGLTRSYADTMRVWQDFGSKIRTSKTNQAMRWSSVRRSIKACEPLLLQNAEVLRAALRESNRRLAPLEDPLLTDYGVHRWLQHAREESYSDWLAWSIDNLDDPVDVLRLFGLAKCMPQRVVQRKRWKVVREQRTTEGHPGRKGRIDLSLVIPGIASVQCELKLGDAEQADTEKQAGYKQSALKYGVPQQHRFHALIITTAESEAYPGTYKAITWSHIAIQLRGIALRCCSQRKYTRAALLLGFVGAIEQNLLGHSSDVACKALSSSSSVMVSSGMIEHLQHALDAAKVGVRGGKR